MYSLRIRAVQLVRLSARANIVGSLRLCRGISTLRWGYGRKNGMKNLVRAYSSAEVPSTKVNTTPLTCASCGVELQESDPDAPGYFKDPKKKESVKHGKERNIIEEARERALLAKFKELDPELEMKPPPAKTNKDERMWCQKCLDTKHRSEFELENQSFMTADEVMSEVPADANVVCVVSALDFPLSISKRVIAGRPQSKIWYIVTKADAFYGAKQGLDRTGVQYFEDSLERLVGADPSHVFLVAGKLGWNTEGLLAKLPKGKLYFVGSVNSGKSTLVRTLIYRDDRSLRSSNHYGPGISEVPGFTAAQMKYELKESGTVLIDTPGYSPKSGGIYPYLLKENVKMLGKVATYASAEPSRHKTHSPIVKGRKVFDGRDLFSVGGFFYLRPPKDTIIRIFTCIPGVEAKYGGIRRARVLNETRKKELGKRFSVNKDAAENLVRYIIPPFYGSVDLVVAGLGYLTIVPCGAPVAGLFQVYVPEGVDVCIREAIFGYIYNTKSNKDETGNQLSKKHIAKRGTTRLRRVPKNKLIFTKLHEVFMATDSWDAFAEVVPMSVARRKMEAGRTQEEYPNEYWRALDLNM